MNDFFAVILVKIHFISKAVSTTPTATGTIQFLAIGSTAARYTICPLKNTRMPTRNTSWPFSLKTQRRLSSTSAIHPRTKPMMISLAVCPPPDAIRPTVTKHSEASPFSAAAKT